jgi:hypothetical protein
MSDLRAWYREKRCYVCSAWSSDPCGAVGGQVAECPRPTGLTGCSHWPGQQVCDWCDLDKQENESDWEIQHERNQLWDQRADDFDREGGRHVGS